MPRFYRESSYHRQIRYIRIVRRIVLFVVVVAVCGGAIIFYDSWRQSKKTNQPSAPSALTKSTFASSLEVYRTQYFQFQAGKSWKTVANESTGTKFVYRKFDRNLVEAQLEIYVNAPANQNLDANRVLIVTFSPASDKLNALFVSERCSKEVKNVGNRTMTVQGVAFRCNTDITDYSVIVGKEGGETLLDMVRPDSSKITYVIYFKDHRAIAAPQELEAIIDTFQTR